MSMAAPLRSIDPPSSAEQLCDPIAFIREEHDRQCQICDQLDELPASLDMKSLVAWAKSLRSFLSVDLQRHIEDEEKDLFPALAQRCAERPGFQELLAQLAAEHELDVGLVAPILRELETIIEAGAPADPNRLFMYVRAFTETQRRHLLWENRMLLPLAEAALTEADKAELARRLAARRGLRLP